MHGIPYPWRRPAGQSQVFCLESKLDRKLKRYLMLWAFGSLIELQNSVEAVFSCCNSPMSTNNLSAQNGSYIKLLR